MGVQWTEIGPCRLGLGDCREAMAEIVGGSVDMIWTDPPYGHGNMDGDLQSARVRDGVVGARVAEVIPITNDTKADYEAVIEEFLSDSVRVLNRDCCCCCCCCSGGGGPTVTFAKLAERMDTRGLSFFHAIVWDKSARGNGLGWRYRRNYEFVMVCHRVGGKLLWAKDEIAVPNIVRHMPVKDRIHPNEKPVDLVESFLRWHAPERSTVLDPFMGSGVVGVACINLGHQFIGIEIDPHWFDVACKRITDELSRNALFDPPPVPRQLEAF